MTEGASFFLYLGDMLHSAAFKWPGTFVFRNLGDSPSPTPTYYGALTPPPPHISSHRLRPEFTTAKGLG